MPKQSYNSTILLYVLAFATVEISTLDAMYLQDHTNIAIICHGAEVLQSQLILRGE